MVITIDSEFLNEVKLVLAYPSVDNVILTDTEIKALCIWPAMQQYFVKWPIRTYYEGNVSTSTIIDFEEDETFGVLDVRVVSQGLTSGSGNSFWDMVRYQAIGGGASRKSTGAYGIPGYNPSGYRQQNMEQIALQKTMQRVYSTTKYRVSLSERKVYVNVTSSSGVLNITWANYSVDFDDVKFGKQRDVIKLAQANMLDHLADTTSIISDSTMDISINYSDLRSRADELRNPIIEKWNEIPDIILLHG